MPDGSRPTDRTVIGIVSLGIPSSAGAIDGISIAPVVKAVIRKHAIERRTPSSISSSTGRLSRISNGPIIPPGKTGTAALSAAGA